MRGTVGRVPFSATCSTLTSIDVTFGSGAFDPPPAASGAADAECRRHDTHTARAFPSLGGGRNPFCSGRRLGQDQVAVAELVPEVAVVERGGVAALEQLRAGGGLEQPEV